MENDTCDLFNTEALSFDSTLDSLMDVDYISDDTALPFHPPTIDTPSNVLMSAQNSLRADIGQNGGETGDQGMSELKEEEVNVGDSKSLRMENSEKRSDESIHIDIEIKDRLANDTREPSPNFDEIKAKRKKNLAKQKPAVKRTVEISSPSSVKAVCDRQTKLDLSQKHIQTGDKEPPMKKMKMSETNNQKKDTEMRPNGDQDNGIYIKRDSDGMLSKDETNKVAFQVDDSLQSKIDNQTSEVADEIVDKEINAGTKVNENEDVHIGKLKKSLLHDGIQNAKEKGNIVEAITGNHELSANTTKFDGQMKIESKSQNEERLIQEELEDAKLISERISDIDENEITENESELKTDVDDVNDTITSRESDIDYDNDDNDDGDDTEAKAGEEFDDEDDDFEDEDVDDDEIHNWLEEGLTKEEIKEKRREDLKDGEFISREKTVLEDKGSSPFEMLPAGWVMIAHNSGMPVYLHKESRVCTFGRPYYIGSGSSRKHDVPLSAIPCLQYRRELEKEKTQKVEADSKTDVKIEQEAIAEKSLPVPKPVVKSVDDAEFSSNIAPEELNKYCRGLFTFRTVTVKKFKTWREKRAHMLEERKKKETIVPRLAPDTKLITCPIPADFSNSKKSKKKEFVLNPEGKTAVSILHEYTQNVLRVQPTYEFKEISNAELPFQATVMINGMQYGSGIASGKRQAKNEGAKATLEIFMPELAELWSEKSGVARQKDELSSDLKFFEDIAIEDPRVSELCVKSSLPQPYQVLHTCLQRNYGLGDTTFKVDKKMISNQKTEFTLSVGKRTCTVVCKNKRQAKQQAAQKMLQELHPFLKNWAAILRLYSRSTEIGYNERKEEFSAQEFHHEKKKNKEILCKLKDAMQRIKEQRKNFSAGGAASIPVATPKTLDL